MFRKLRNRFLILNLVTISIMMFIAFSAIYFITWRNVHNDINMDLHRISDFNRGPVRNAGQPQPDLKSFPSGLQGGAVPGSNAMPPPERFVSFFLTTDRQWNIITFSSTFTTDNEFYTSAKNEVAAQNRDTGTFKLDGNDWAYLLTSVPEGYRIVCLDITSRQGILTTLIYTFLLVELVMLIFIYLISRFFANRYIQPVKEAFDKQKHFIADASHELKTPLAVINTNADVLLSYGEDTIHNQSKWIHYIKSEAERMSKLTNDLLYLTQMDYSNIKMIFAKFNMSEAVENAILTMEAVIFERNISLQYDIEPHLTAYGNSGQIREVVMILLDNALKYTNPGGSVTITLKRRNNDIVLSVANTGEGIPEEHLEKIFDRFYRTDKSRARKLGGYGLGLAIARAIMDHHKGRIYARSILNENTTFYAELPLVSE